MQAVWNGTVIADSDETVVVEGNHYFPIGSVRDDVLRPTAKRTTCAWKGEASYFSLEVDGQVNQDQSWTITGTVHQRMEARTAHRPVLVSHRCLFRDEPKRQRGARRVSITKIVDMTSYARIY